MKRTLLATAIILALAATPTVFAKGKPPPTDEMGNNPSFPTKFVGSEGAPITRAICSATERTIPWGPQCTNFPGYWCQKTEAIWQAVCESAPTDGSVFVNTIWGSNLLGDAPLKAGKPIRVEMTLTEVAGVSGLGYVVDKLTPELEDRLATYGTSGADYTGAYVVYDAGATLTIETCPDKTCLVPNGTVLSETIFTAELNSLGKVVYGYNWGTSGKATAAQPGIYKLTFRANGTTIASPSGAQMCPLGENCVYVIIEVTQSSGGGGGGGPPNRP
jgi:hypothetical protein